MADERKSPQGFFVSRPREGAPEFVKGNIGIKVEDFLPWLSEIPEEFLHTDKHGKEWLRLDIKEGFREDPKTGLKAWYSQVNDWKPSAQRDEKKEDDDGLPF